MELKDCKSLNDIVLWLHNALAQEHWKDPATDDTLDFRQPKVSALIRMAEIAREEALEEASHCVWEAGYNKASEMIDRLKAASND